MKHQFDTTITECMKSAASDNFANNIVMIDVDELHESEDNFFDVSRIEEFAETIYEQGGVMENLIVQPIIGGGYEVISGHRRTAAVRYLLQTGKRVSRVLPCLVRDYGDSDEKRMDIILMNVTARIISDSEMWKCYEIINEVLQNKKKMGEKFGQVQKKLAEILGVSTGQAAKMQNIDRRAAPEVKTAIENGEISINTAEKLAKLGENQQKSLLEKGTSDSPIMPKDIEDFVTNDNFGDDSDDVGEVITDDDSAENSEDYGEVETPPPKCEKSEPPIANLRDYVVQNSGVIIGIFDTYLGITDNEGERAIITEIKRFIQVESG